MKVMCNGSCYRIRLCFTKLVYCDVDDVVFNVMYFSKDGRNTKWIIKKQHDTEKFVIVTPTGRWCEANVIRQVKILMDIFLKECNFTFSHYRNTIDYLRTDVGYYLAKYHYIYIADDLIWYALFSTPYSLYNYS
jgi:hypothetical protein